jgi:hypothetical protein
MSNTIDNQIELLEELVSFLGDLQEGLNSSIQYYENALGKMQSEGLFTELVEKQRVEYYAVTKQQIDNLISLISRQDKRYAVKVAERLIRIAKS